MLTVEEARQRMLDTISVLPTEARGNFRQPQHYSRRRPLCQ